jgi:hypothetical protein
MLLLAESGLAIAGHLRGLRSNEDTILLSAANVLLKT